MRTIKRSTAFKKDFRRILAQPRHAGDMPQLLQTILTFLVSDQSLPKQFRDHALTGNWKDYRECHIKPDLLLIYQQFPNIDVLELIRLGSHADLFGC